MAIDGKRLLGRMYSQSSMEGPQSSHSFCLYTCHSKKVLEICEVGGELCQLRVKMRLPIALAGFVEFPERLLSIGDRDRETHQLPWLDAAWGGGEAWAMRGWDSRRHYDVQTRLRYAQ